MKLSKVLKVESKRKCVRQCVYLCVSFHTLASNHLQTYKKSSVRMFPCRYGSSPSSSPIIMVDERCWVISHKYTYINILPSRILCDAFSCIDNLWCEAAHSTFAQQFNYARAKDREWRKEEGKERKKEREIDEETMRIHVSHGFCQQLFDNIGTNLKLVLPINNENMMLMFTLNLQVRVVSKKKSRKGEERSVCVTKFKFYSNEQKSLSFSLGFCFLQWIYLYLCARWHACLSMIKHFMLFSEKTIPFQ